MSKPSFAIWQLTKLVLFAPLFANIMFGMAADYSILKGHDIGLGSIGTIFAIPFANIPANGSYAQANVLQMFPALTLIIPALLAAVGLRVLLYIGVSGTVQVVSQYMMDARESKPKFLSYISTIEIILGATILWVGFTMFFSHEVDFNTRYAIVGTLALGAALIAYGFFDRVRARVIIYPTKKHIYSRLLTVGAVIIIVGAIMTVNLSIAGTKKAEWFGPYIAQEIAVNRYMHDLDQVQIVNYDARQPLPAASDIKKIVDDNKDVLGSIQLFDQQAAKDKPTSVLAQRNDIDYVDADIIRSGGTAYWAGSTAPKIPDAQSNPWSAEHLVYTHSNAGIELVQADNGNVVDGSKLFPQDNIYYGESGKDGGVFSKYWSAFTVGRTDSNEVDHFFYNGTGGINLSPPLSWMFDPTFMLSDTASTIHVMRYKDVNTRMDLLYPYFVYQFSFGGTPTNPNFQNVDVYPVSDGKNTYWLMPLITLLDTSSVPWSSNSAPSFMLKLTGYALIDAYNGSVQVIVTGDDYFSNMFYDQYKDAGATREIPQWLGDQLKYPQEMAMWRISKFNTYHATDPTELIDGKTFYATPEDPKKDPSPPYYVFAKPQGFEKPEFVAVQPLQIKDSTSKNLAGYMVVENDPQNLGKMTFYSLTADSKMLGPGDASSAITSSKDYQLALAPVKNNGPRLGDALLYKIGNYEVYFSTLFANTGGAQAAAVAAVGATPTTGTPYVGIGDTPAQAFDNYLQKLAGIAPAGGQQPPPATGNQTTPGIESRIQQIEKMFEDSKLKVVKPTSITAPVTFSESSVVYKADSDLAQAQSAVHDFIEKFASQGGGRVFEWRNGTQINFGVLQNVDGIVENHYISIETGQ